MLANDLVCFGAFSNFLNLMEVYKMNDVNPPYPNTHTHPMCKLRSTFF